jgi:CII-binding regulator of phage lambda lysogenization HflD
MQLKELDLFDGNVGVPVITPCENDADDLSMVDDAELEVNSAAKELELLLDFQTLQIAFEGCQENLRVYLDNQVSFKNALKEGLKDELLKMVTDFASYVSELKGTTKQLEQLRERIYGLQTHLNYYKEKAENDRCTVPLVPLKEAIITVINDLVSSRQ